MKCLLASDIHGNLVYLDILLERIKVEKPDRVIILGDIYPYGGCNDVLINNLAERLNSISNLNVIRGNCDFDDSYFNFNFQDRLVFSLNNKTIYCTHGHIHNYNYPPELFDVLIYGHEHIGYIKIRNDKIFVNTGSIGNPRYGSPRSYVIIDDKEILLKSLDGNVIDYISYN